MLPYQKQVEDIKESLIDLEIAMRNIRTALQDKYPNLFELEKADKSLFAYANRAHRQLTWLIRPESVQLKERKRK